MATHGGWVEAGRGGGGVAGPGRQVGREGEVRRVGVRSDSHKLLPELYSAPAAGYDSARLLM